MQMGGPMHGGAAPMQMGGPLRPEAALFVPMQQGAPHGGHMVPQQQQQQSQQGFDRGGMRGGPPRGGGMRQQRTYFDIDAPEEEMWATVQDFNDVSSSY
jgi:hypothetical protein